MVIGTLTKAMNVNTAASNMAMGQKPRKLAGGGMVSGPGTSTSDSIPALLSDGESVINANSTSMFSPLLDRINQVGGGKPFNMGESSTSPSKMTSQPPIKAYVVSTDMTSQQQMDRSIKNRSTI